MSTRIEATPWMPDARSWLLLAAVVTVGLTFNWIFAAGLMVFVFAQMARPFHFLLAFLLVVTGASFISNSGGGLTFQLSLLMSVMVFAFVCYVLNFRDRVFSLCLSPLTVPVVAFIMLSLANAARGVLMGNHLRNLGLEFVAILGLGTSLIVANAFDAKRDLRFATIALIVIAQVASLWGFHSFAEAQTRTANAYTVALPGIVAMLLVNMALRSKNLATAFLWVLLSVPLFLHQLITFGRGLWTGCFAGLIVTFLVFGGRGLGARARWTRSMAVVGLIAGIGLIGAFQLVVVMGQRDLLQDAVTRLMSIGSTKEGIETRSNMIRLFEYATVIPIILSSPWVGQGLGFTFAVEEPFSRKYADQWGVHQNYLLVWLKQGAIGLALFIWMLWTATAMGAREARRRSDPWESTWFATIAAGTVFLAVFSLTNYPFAVVNEMFLLGLLWGAGMAMARTGSLSLRWSSSPVVRTADAPRATWSQKIFPRRPR
ncbi:MAG TPA: O-antigen ligase family protein [Candidatus Eisenbacteria bacterium]|nr:O-antigen ligase family protein [Candidatus Eisenbacteria bacterium]